MAKSILLILLLLLASPGQAQQTVEGPRASCGEDLFDFLKREYRKDKQFQAPPYTASDVRPPGEVLLYQAKEAQTVNDQIEKYNLSLAIPGNHTFRAYVGRAEAYHRKGKFAQALYDYRRALRMTSWQTWEHRNRAGEIYLAMSGVYYDAGQHSECLEFLNAAEKFLGPAHRTRAEMAKRRKDYRKSILELLLLRADMKESMRLPKVSFG